MLVKHVIWIATHTLNKMIITRHLGGIIMAPDWIIKEFGHTLQEVAEIINNLNRLATTHKDTRCCRIEYGINYYGENRLEVHGLPHLCYIVQFDNFLDRFKRVRFTYEGKYFFEDMDITDVISFLKDELKKIPPGTIVKPEKHGYWVLKSPSMIYKCCSYCGYELSRNKALFANCCPSCNAIMDLANVNNR